MSETPPKTRPVPEGQPQMTEELLALLRHRVATRFYDQPHVIDAVARAILAGKDV